MSSVYFPERPRRTSQAEPRGRPRVRTIATIQRASGWRMEIVVLSGRSDLPPAITITTQGPAGGGSRVHLELSDLADLEDAIGACRAAADQPGARSSGTQEK